MGTGASHDVSSPSSEAESYTNPIVAGDYPDPGANKIGDHFYLVATGGGPKGAFRILRSPDLIHWEPCGQVFGPHNLPSWSGGASGQKCDYWAPEIHQLPSCVGVFFTAREPAEVGRALHIGLATAKHPEGPYQDLGHPLISDPHWAIDASYFHDKTTGKQFVLWKVDGNAHKVASCIKLRELDETGTSLVGDCVTLIQSDQKWEGGVVEGPFLLRRDGFYYLFYSGECYANHRYCVGVARAENVLGPYVKSGAPVLSSGTGWAGPGHCVVVDAGSDNQVMIFHAWPSNTPGGRGEHGKGRAVLMERITWEDAWPTVGSGVPCTEPQSRLADPSTASTVGGHFVPRPPLQMNQTYRLQVSQGWDSYLGYEGKLSKSKDEVFTVRPGLLPGGTVSLEASGQFLRHRCGKLELAPNDGSQLFASDASWMALPGLGAGGVSLRSVNFPDSYARHKDGELYSNTFEMNDTYLADATWKPVLV